MRVRSCVAAVFGAALLHSSPVAAQVENDINVATSTTGFSVIVHVDMDIGGTLPEHWTGWILNRTSIGICEPDFRVGNVRQFEAGPHSYSIEDPTAQAGVTYKYRVYAVDDQLTKYSLGAPPAFPPAYYHDDYATPSGTAAVARGTIVDLGWTYGVELCPDECWEWISFISSAPPSLAALAGTGIPVEIFGRIDNEFEGPYISSVSAWSTSDDACGPVSNEPGSWGALKANYR